MNQNNPQLEIRRELNERLSSPFFFSFIISWCVFNWKIIIGIFFYDLPELYCDGYNSYINLIYNNLHISTSICWPAISAILYTFGYPLIRNGIYVFNTYIDQKAENYSIKARKDGSVSINKYLQLRQIYKDRTAYLESIIQDESVHTKKINELQDQLLSLRDEKRSSDEELMRWKETNDSSIIDGEWEVKSEASLTDENSSYTLHISFTHVQLISSLSHTKKGSIKMFYRIPDSNSIQMVVRWDDSSNTIPVYSYYYLNIFEDMQLLSGIIDSTYKIRFKRR